MNETEKKYTIIEVNFMEATEVGKNSIKFTEISRNNIQHKMKVIGHIENGVSIPATTPDLVIPEAPVAKVEEEKEIVPEVTTVNKTDENFRVISNPKKLKLPNGTFVTVKEATTMKLANEATRTELSPHYSSLVSEPVVEKPTIEESKEEEAKLDGPIWNVKEEPEVEPIVDTPEPVEEPVVTPMAEMPKEEEIIPQVESPKEEIPVSEIPQGVKPYENSFTPTDTPSIATGLEESDLAKKAREAIQARIEAAKKKATQEAEAEIAKANAEAAKAREEAAQAKKDKETVEEELSKTRSDLDNLSEEVRKAQQEAISAKTKIAAYEEVFKEFTSPVDDTPLSRAA